MVVVSVHRGSPRKQAGCRTKTGIDKTPVAGPVLIGPDGVEGDYIGDSRYHGGPDQAIYIYGGRDYAWWEATDGKAYRPGTFGENVVVSDLETGDLAVGDRLAIGESVVLEVTDARIPCGTLARHVDEPEFPARFTAAERPGAYCRVLRGGILTGDEIVAITPYPEERLLLREIVRDHASKARSIAAIQRFLSVPISARLRAKKEKQLADLLSRSGGVPR